ncbi:hypothetical protein G9Q38_07210 [Pusillimonas sp. DMV24BSW_D]|uniref:hypothetical protein n=1 Tax=Neopusillimonas aestuarii TaxID=2716226 RepID=UPI00140ACBD8|nr:hypothetical protein [Pusillimonas sp. DMV24BSW_D]QIM48984.1 hypothetical protein G9Q38_07210 [Pusillimonas sp. DMV24BSW_D]
MKDLKNNIAVVSALAAAVHTATKADAAIVDLQGANSATVVINTGAIAGAGDFTVSLVHGDESDLSDSAAVTAGDLLGEFPASLAADSAYSVGYRGVKRYLRVVITQNSGTSIAAAAVIVKGHLNLAPAV